MGGIFYGRRVGRALVVTDNARGGGGSFEGGGGRGYLLVLESPQGACVWMANNETTCFVLFFCVSIVPRVWLVVSCRWCVGGGGGGDGCAWALGVYSLGLCRGRCGGQCEGEV